jgi:hypothetical protein
VSTRVMIGMICLGAILYAGYRDNLAATYVAAAAFAIIYLLHTIEFKLDRLLDHQGIFVGDGDIARD